MKLPRRADCKRDSIAGARDANTAFSSLRGTLSLLSLRGATRRGNPEKSANRPKSWIAASASGLLAMTKGKQRTLSSSHTGSSTFRASRSALRIPLFALFLLPSFLFADVTLEQKSEPEGLFGTQTATKTQGSSVDLLNPSLFTGGKAFTHWTLNGTRQESPDGQARNRVTFQITENVVAIAHYLPDNEDSDEDGIADWREIRFFGSLDEDQHSDVDGDGFTLEEEIRYDTSPTIEDHPEEGGVSRRRSRKLFLNLGGAKELIVTSDPPGWVTHSETLPETNSSYSTDNLTGALSGYRFGYWERNGERMADVSGIA